MCFHKHNPLKKDKEPFLKIKEIKNNILINNNGKEKKLRSSFYLLLSNLKKSITPKKLKNLVFIVFHQKTIACDMFHLASYFKNNYLKMTTKNKIMISILCGAHLGWMECLKCNSQSRIYETSICDFKIGVILKWISYS